MYATLSWARPAVLVVHDGGAALDVLPRRFEASGFVLLTTETPPDFDRLVAGAASGATVVG